MTTLGATQSCARLASWPLAILFGLCSSACTPSPAPASEPPQASPASEPPPAHPPIAEGSKLPPSHPPVAPGASTAAANAPAPEGPATAGGLRWEHQPPLVRRAPKSSMRAAEYGLVDDAQAELTVFYFGPDQGGSVDANVTRWLGQLIQPDGKDTASLAKRKKREVEGVTVNVVEATGRFGGGMGMPGAPPTAEIPDALLLGAIAEGPQGPVFFKLVGPRAAVESARGAFDALIGSLRR